MCERRDTEVLQTVSKKNIRSFVVETHELIIEHLRDQNRKQRDYKCICEKKSIEVLTTNLDFRL